ncbi:hypothetical protein [Paenibacillus tengchongensis]|uniref:hypothetical protein n=1 Tax=Paenibacillus tengchongensis TaxID=2608684 RepID=UPI00124EBFD7|nr:hypothetical protein [Paenibacillus tengchongensis]
MTGESAAAVTRTVKGIGKGFILLFAVPILGVWTAGSLICAGIAVIAGILGAFGWEGVTLAFSPELSLPGILALPLGIVLALLLYGSHLFARRGLRSCLQFVRS